MSIHECSAHTIQCAHIKSVLTDDITVCAAYATASRWHKMTFEIESASPSAFHASSFAGKHQAAFVLVDSEGDWPHNQSLYMHVNGKHHRLESASPHDLEQAGLDWLPKVLAAQVSHLSLCKCFAHGCFAPSINWLKSSYHTQLFALPCRVKYVAFCHTR